MSVTKTCLSRCGASSASTANWYGESSCALRRRRGAGVPHRPFAPGAVALAPGQSRDLPAGRADRRGAVSADLRQWIARLHDQQAARASGEQVAQLQTALRVHADLEQNKELVVTSLSHDLRGLLTTVKGYAQMLQRHAVRSEATEGLQGLQRIEGMARRPARASGDSGLYRPGSLPLHDQEWPIAWALADHEVPQCTGAGAPSPP
jgi:signal transduction histidine kinase